MKKVNENKEVFDIFSEIYLFKSGIVSKIIGNKVISKYRYSANSCTCPSTVDCKHLKMLRGEYIVGIEEPSIVAEVMYKIASSLKESELPTPSSPVSSIVIDSKVKDKNGPTLIVGIKNNLVVYFQ